MVTFFSQARPMIRLRRTGVMCLGAFLLATIGARAQTPGSNSVAAAKARVTFCEPVSAWIGGMGQS